MFENKKIFILGMARSGYEVAKLLSKYNNQIIINDFDINQEKQHIEELKKLNISVILGSHPEEILDTSFDYLIKNPGIKDTHPYIEYCKKNHIKVVNEVEVAYHFLPKNITIIGITGTNGKTTTTTLIYEILKKANKSVYLAGNIGYPLSSFVDKLKDGDILVIEISVQQLLNFDRFKTNMSVLTNISPTHLDHVQTYENYKKITKKIFHQHTESDLAIINYSDKESMELTKDILSTKIYFSSKEETNLCIKNGYIYYQNNEIINLKDIKLVGDHNYENIMCAIAVVKELQIDNQSIKEILRSFAGVEHRLEFVRRVNGRDFYNDSKATNNESTKIALSAFEKPTILFLGGLDRGQTFDELEQYMKHVKSVITYGETKHKIHAFCDKIEVPSTIVNNLKEATDLAYHLSEENDIILLSPACASWDQYKKFEDRGNEFKQIVEEIGKE